MREASVVVHKSGTAGVDVAPALLAWVVRRVALISAKRRAIRWLDATSCCGMQAGTVGDVGQVETAAFWAAGRGSAVVRMLSELVRGMRILQQMP